MAFRACPGVPGRGLCRPNVMGRARRTVMNGTNGKIGATGAVIPGKTDERKVLPRDVLDLGVCEARDFLKSKLQGFASNSFSTATDGGEGRALEFVEKLYALGGVEEIMVDGIM